MNESINVLAELERAGTKYEFSAQDEVKIVCPFHADKSPSCCVNTEKRIFVCKTAGCEASGSIIKLLARILNTQMAVVIADLQTRYAFDTDKTIDIQVVERYHKQIWSATVLINELYKRGVHDGIIRQRRLGEIDGRVSIPIPNANGQYVNIRKYLPGAPGKDKMRNMPGRGKMRIYPYDQLKYDKILVTGGECKALVAADQLNPHGIGAICATCGEDNWDIELTQELKGKEKVWVCLDVDSAGQKAAAIKCIQIQKQAKWTGNVLLPLDIDKHPKGDINDYIATEHGLLLPLLEACEEFKHSPLNEYTIEDVAKEIDLFHAIHAKQTGKRITVKSTVTSMDTSPYIIPKKINIICEESEKYCAVCPVFMQQKHEYIISPESPALLKMISKDESFQLEILKDAIGIPKCCRVCSFAATEHYNIEDARVSPQLEITNRQTERVLQPAFCIGDGLELNESYNLTGRMFPHPRTQQSTLLISGYHTTEDALSSYKCEGLEALSLFWPNEWSVEGIQQQLNERYDDLSSNVTRIFQRQDLHLAMDLAYHSMLHITFDGMKGQKGWIDTLILGDPAQGKSEVACGSTGEGGFKKHYGLGAKIECKNASVAGLLGGLQNLSGRFFVSWGHIPMHDKRLLIIEEMKGASIEVISKLTDLRSSGWAEIPKIEKRRTHARARLIWTSNSRSGMFLSQYNFGLEAILELVGSQEDIRRFDYVMLLGREEIDSDAINALQSSRPYVEHRYTSQLCKQLILWCWTRLNDQVHFTDDATKRVLERAGQLCETFTGAIAIVDRGSMRMKLARMSAAMAGLTFSCTEDFQHCIIHPAHVDYAADWLTKIYSKTSFGYIDYTKAQKITEELIDPDKLMHAISTTPHADDLIKHLLAKNLVDLQDLCDWCAWDREEANKLLSLFVRKHALIRTGKTAYRKTSPFIVLLKDMQLRGGYFGRPKHAEERNGNIQC